MFKLFNRDRPSYDDVINQVGYLTHQLEQLEQVLQQLVVEDQPKKVGFIHFDTQNKNNEVT